MHGKQNIKNKSGTDVSELFSVGNYVIAASVCCVEFKV
jgi:hypothetical protein